MTGDGAGPFRRTRGRETDMEQLELARGRIVVGADGSPGSHDALRWAAHYAGVTGRSVLLVTAWHFPMMYGTVPAPGVDFEAEGRQVLDDALKTAEAEFPGVHFETLLMPGRAADCLIWASDGAEVLVIGSRGHGGFTGMLLGSVSMHCVGHAHCPVVVVR